MLRINLAGLILVAGLALAGVNAAHAQSAPKGWTDNDLIAVERCVGFILMGPTYEGLGIRGDDFICKAAGNISINGQGDYQIRGELSHQLRLRADDESRMNITLSPGGVVKEIFVVESDGGVLGTVGLGDINARDMQLRPEWAALTGAEAVRAVAADHPSKGWRETARVIGQVLAIELGRSVRDRSGALAYWFDRPGADLRRFEMLNGRVYSGGRIDSRYPHSYIETCEASCNVDGACKAWTILRAKNGKQPICFLKAAGTEPQLARDTVSGAKLAPKIKITNAFKLGN